MPRRPTGPTIAALTSRLRSLWRVLRRRGQVEAEIAEEFRHHLDLRTEDLMRRGLSARAAARQARLEFGSIDRHREDARASLGLQTIDRLGFSWLDVKLGMRMLAKHPGLSLVSVIGLSVAIAIGAGAFGLIHALMDAPLPLDEGRRVVSLQNSDVRNPGSPARRSLHDFLLWREELGTVRDLSAFRTDDVNLSIPGGSTANVRVARMTASGFRVARVAPVLGRAIQEDDEAAGASPVLVIAHEEWQRRFRGDPQIIGRTVRLDTAVHTVVGVMPEGFRFPVDHRYWVPLRLDPASHALGGGPELSMFGRLADGATLERAQAELDGIGRRMAADYPATHEHLRPWIRPYTHAFIGIDSPARAWLIRVMQMGLSLLLVVVSVNVAILVYARTAARTGEIAVRTALGASRRRVVTQLFAEALVLSGIAALIGLAIADLGFDWIRDLLVGGDAARLPFWVNMSLTPALIAYVAGLAILAAAIVGIVPALRATGRTLQGTLQQISSRGSRLELGRTWSALIVLQVTVAVAALPYALHATGAFVGSAAARPDYPVGELMRAALSIEAETLPAPLDSAARQQALAARFAGSVTEVLQRLDALPEVSGATVASSFPGDEVVSRAEIEGVDAPEWVWLNQVGIDFFDIFDVPVLAGRAFLPSDRASSANTVIVDRVFADLLGGRNVIGRRIRSFVPHPDGTGATEPWLEIVGIVPAFTPPPPFERSAPKIYRPLDLANTTGTVQLAVRLRRGSAPSALLGRVREIASTVDPALQFRELLTASEAERQRTRGFLSLALAIAAVTGSVLLLSAAGIYAMMSFTVASRRREIGIRTALGAAPRRVLSGIFRRAATQIATGVLCGLALAELGAHVIGGGSLLLGEAAPMLPAVVALMSTIGLLAALGPARRGLAIQPTEALREE